MSLVGFFAPRNTMPPLTTSELRLVETVEAVLMGTPADRRRVGITTLNKALFYADLVALRDLGRTLTGARYHALQFGPVVEDYPTKLIDVVERAGVARQAEGDDGLEKPVVLVETPPFSILDEDEVQIARNIGSKTAQMTATKLVRMSHENLGWKLAWDAGRGQGKPAVQINMLIALQQLADDDPWLTAPVDDDLRAAFDRATPDSGSIWE